MTALRRRALQELALRRMRRQLRAAGYRPDPKPCAFHWQEVWIDGDLGRRIVLSRLDDPRALVEAEVSGGRAIHLIYDDPSRLRRVLADATV